MPPKKTILRSDQVELIYVQSKAYIHPTTSKKDNIAGFLSLSRGANASNNDIHISFTTENQLSTEELKIYNQVDLEEILNDLAALKLTSHQNHPVSSQNIKFSVVPKPPVSVLSGYSFSIPISFIYSIQVRNPSSGWWYGSIIINTQDGEKLPIVFFHDDESPSTIRLQKVRNQRFDPFGEDGTLFWGGSEFIRILSQFADLQKSSIEPSVYLVNPDSADLRSFAPFKTKSETKQAKQKQEPFKLPDVKLPDVNKFFNTAKWKVLEAVATLSLKTKSQVLELVDERAPDQIKKLLNHEDIKSLNEEFESARVYLAKWAAQVKEEADESLKKFMLTDEVYNKINKEIGSTEILTIEEINAASRRKPVTKVEWEAFFDYTGRFSITTNEIKSRIFHGGLEDLIRGEAWLFLLGVYPWDSSKEERETLRASYKTAYDELKLKWVINDGQRDEEFWRDQKHRIEKDINRTDRNLAIFLNKKKNIKINSIGSDSLPEARESSPETPDEDEIEEEEEHDFDISNIKNIHLYRMREILLTFNEYNLNLGYVQGMTDLLSPLYVKFQDESLTFWAFSNFMIRMERNFVRDQSGMKIQMLTLNELVRFMLPDLFKHLEKCELSDLFFFFRMLLVWFKREFEWNDVLKIWEILWTDFYSSQYHLFIALAVLSENERIIRENLERFDEVLKYMNDLSMKMNLENLLIRAELLFLRFRRMVDIIDRENTYKKNSAITSGSHQDQVQISPELRSLLSKDLVIQKEVPRPEGVGGG